MAGDAPAGASTKRAIIIDDPDPAHRAFSFLTLPPEIRNTIYDLVFVSPSYIGTKGTQTKAFYKDAARWRNLSFAKSCRQIYHESGNIFFARNGFEFHYTRPFLEFMEAIGPDRRKLLSKIRYYWTSGHPFVALRYLRSCTNVQELDIFVQINAKGKKNSGWFYPLDDAKTFFFSKAKVIKFGPARAFGKAAEIPEDRIVAGIKKCSFRHSLERVQGEMAGTYKRPELPNVFKDGRSAWKYERNDKTEVEDSDDEIDKEIEEHYSMMGAIY